jgi:hypothetical protein
MEEGRSGRGRKRAASEAAPEQAPKPPSRKTRRGDAEAEGAAGGAASSSREGKERKAESASAPEHGKRTRSSQAAGAASEEATAAGGGSRSAKEGKEAKKEAAAAAESKDGRVKSRRAEKQVETSAPSNGAGAPARPFMPCKVLTPFKQFCPCSPSLQLLQLLLLSFALLLFLYHAFTITHTSLLERKSSGVYRHLLRHIFLTPFACGRMSSSINSNDSCFGISSSVNFDLGGRSIRSPSDGGRTSWRPLSLIRTSPPSRCGVASFLSCAFAVTEFGMVLAGRGRL